MKKSEILQNQNPNQKRKVLITIISSLIVFVIVVIFLLQQKESHAVTPLSEKEISLYNGSQYALNGFVVGMPYKEMEKRLKKTETFTPNLREIESKEEFYQIVENKMFLEAPGYEYGYISYSFGGKEGEKKKFLQGICYLYFSTYSEGLAYMESLIEPLFALNQLEVVKLEGNTELRYRFQDKFDTRIEVVLAEVDFAMSDRDDWQLAIFLCNYKIKYGSDE